MTRIVSLIPSATEIIHCLGMGDYQVGRSHECDYPPPVTSLPVCTAPKFQVSGNSSEIDNRVKETLSRALSVYDVFEQVLEELRPTHVITQSQCDVCAVSLKDVQSAVAQYVSSSPQIVSLQPTSLAEVWGDILHVAQALDVPSQGEKLLQLLRQQGNEIGHRAQTASTHPRVACIEWLEPLMGAGNWVPELVEIAGGTHLLGRAGHHSGYIEWEEIIQSDPDIVVLMPCGFNMARTLTETYWLTDRPQWTTLRAVRNDRVYITDGNQYFNRPGPRLADSLRILAEIIHPELFGPTLEGSAWNRLRE